MITESFVDATADPTGPLWMMHVHVQTKCTDEQQLGKACICRG